MIRARATLVSAADTRYYHGVGRCVRRALLCGFDTQSQTSFEHRRGWMQERLALLADTFALDVCAYALMSNHYHLVVRLAPERVTYSRDLIRHDNRCGDGYEPPTVDALERDFRHVHAFYGSVIATV